MLLNIKKCPHCTAPTSTDKPNCQHCGKPLGGPKTQPPLSSESPFRKQPQEPRRQVESERPRASEPAAPRSERPGGPVVDWAPSVNAPLGSGAPSDSAAQVNSNVVAAVLNLICPGLGHLIQGRVVGAIFWFVAAAAGYLAFVVPGLIVHGLSIVSALRHNPNKQAPTQKPQMSSAPPPRL